MTNFKGKNEKPKCSTERCIENGWIRATLLLIALGLGCVLVILLGDWFVCFLGASKAKYSVLLPLFTLPLIFFLWVFRTYDTRQQIAESQAQTHESRFTNGLDKLLNEKSLHISMGVKLLTRLSLQTDGKLDSEIKLAFVKRLQHLPNDIRNHAGEEVSDKSRISIKLPTLNYIPHMFTWIIKNEQKNSMKLDKEKIDVPEMYFQIEELECTEKFTNELTSVFDKKIPLRDIEIALQKLQPMTLEKFEDGVADLYKFTFPPCECALNMDLNKDGFRLIHKLTGKSCNNQTGESRRYDLGVCHDWPGAFDKAMLKLLELDIRNGEVKPCGDCERVAHARHEWDKL